MHLKVLLPTEILVDEEVTRVVAEAQNGFFGMLPRHIDFVTALVPGILSFTSVEHGNRVIAVDEGVLVKCGDDVLVSALNAVRGETLADLHHTVEARFHQLDEDERIARTALARLEAGALRLFAELEEHARGR
jgi:F-type H+-transporting ATPase subunit epsilon